MLIIDILQHIYEYQNSKGEKIKLQIYVRSSQEKRKTLCQVVYLRKCSAKDEMIQIYYKSPKSNLKKNTMKIQ